MIYSPGLSGTNWWDAPFTASQDQLDKLSSTYGVSFVYNPNASENYKYTVGAYGAPAWALWTQIGTAFNGDVNAAVNDWKQQNSFQQAMYAWSGVSKSGISFVDFMASKGVTASNNKYMADQVKTLPPSNTNVTLPPAAAVPISPLVQAPMPVITTGFSISPLMLLIGAGVIVFLIVRK